MVTDLVEAIRATDAVKLILDGTGIGPPRCGVMELTLMTQKGVRTMLLRLSNRESINQNAFI